MSKISDLDLVGGLKSQESPEALTSFIRGLDPTELIEVGILLVTFEVGDFC